MRESKVTDQELNWMYAALVRKQVIDPTYIMVERWICEASSGTGQVGSGCYLTLIARAMNPGLAVIQKILCPGKRYRDWTFEARPLYRRGWKEGIHYFRDGYFPPLSKAKIIHKRKDRLASWKHWSKGEENKKRKVDWRNIGVGTTRKFRSKASTTKFRLLEEWISRCIKWTRTPARMDESMGRKSRSSMGACYGGASTGVPGAPTI